MRVAIVGYGKMGKAIEKVAKEQGLEVVRRIDPKGGEVGALTRDSVRGVDVAFEFTSPETAVENLLTLFEYGIDCVVGTTGWYARIEEVKRAVTERGVGCVYAPNFSVGMNLFFEVVSSAGRLFGGVEDARFGVEEAHHEAKKDAPSGTALKIVEVLRESGARLRENSVPSLRVGYIPGTHKVLIDMPYETISLEHVVRQREVFAYGAVLAARLIRGKKGLFTFAELLRESLKG
ncbi:MAG: dihydrodipicolinate reductase [Planctomycetota bacterium]|nr:dihydrodipicolinate reductase [Planctomycetota bacterium]